MVTVGCYHEHRLCCVLQQQLSMKGIFFISQDARSNQSNITSPTLAYEEDTKIEYFHQNPVKRGYVDEAEHWLYSSARDYAGQDGLFEVSRQW